MTVGYPNFEFKTSSLYEGECNCRYCSVGAFLRHQQGLVYGSKQRQSSMAETEESAMEDENNMTSNITSDADTEAEPQEAEPKRGNRNSIIWLWFGFKKSDTDQTTWICKTRRQQVTSDSNTSDLFYHLKTRHEKQYRDWHKVLTLPQNHRVTKRKKNTPNK